MNGQRPKTPYVYRLVRDASGQSETFGVILLLGITVVGSTAIVAFGTQALSETQDAATSQRTEHTMTLLDSRSAMVALGESDMQTVDFGHSQDGKFSVDQDAGRIKVIHYNFSGNESGNEVIYNKTLGTFYYENGDTTMAYQGGGVWRIQGDGQAVMVSQPEAHYRSATLTMPIIRVRGSGEAAGETSVTVSSASEPRRIFPNTTFSDPAGPAGNETGAPYNNSSEPAKQYTNPIKSGNVTVLINSQFYEGWAHYFETRTTAEVKVYDSNSTVYVRLRTIGDPNFFGTLANDIKMRGLPTKQHSMNNFTIKMTEGKNGGGAFGSMHWSFFAETDNGQKLDMHVTPDGAKCSDVKDGSDPILATIYYENGTSGATGQQSQEWVMEAYESDDFIEEVDCSSDDQYIVVNWTATNTMMDYEPITANSCGNSKWHFADDFASCDGDGPGKATFDQHPVDGISNGPYTTTMTDVENVSYVVNHYMALMGPNFDLAGDEGPGNSNRILEDQSSGNISFDQSGGRFITYLHISENEVEFEVD